MLRSRAKLITDRGVELRKLAGAVVKLLENMYVNAMYGISNANLLCRQVRFSNLILSTALVITDHPKTGK